MHKLRDDKLLKVEELKGKTEAMIDELKKKKTETRDFEDLAENYTTKRDQLFMALSGKDK